MKYITLFILLVVLSSCCESKMPAVIFSEVEIAESEVFFPHFYWGDTLYLNVEIDDCGEWGGPEDNLIISMDSLRQYVLEFKRYKMDCYSIAEHENGKPLEFEKKFILNDTMKVAVSDFLVDIMKAKIEEKADSNAGSTYNLFSNDSALSIRLHSTQKKIEEEYYNFKNDLGLPENRKKK